MAWFKNIFGGIRQGLDERAQDDIDCLTNVILKCPAVEESRQIYRQWVTERIVNAKEKNPYLTANVFSQIVQDVNRQPQAMRAGVDEMLWKIKQAGQV
jgi:hypothetical protein